MANNIITNHTLEQYNKKYRNLRHRLLKITKKEVEDFDKKNPTKTKGYLLSGRKWCLIGDIYYEIPKAPRYTWFRNLNSAVQVGCCLLGAGAITTAIVVPTILAINKNKIDVDVELIEGTKGISVASTKKLDNGALEITLKPEEGKELASIDKVVIGNQELKINTDYTLVGNVITINKDVIEKHKGEKIVITPKVQSSFDPSKDFESDSEFCNASFKEKLGNDFVYEVSIKDDYKATKEFEEAMEHVKVGDYTLVTTPTPEYVVAKSGDKLLLTIRGDVFSSHQGKIKIKPKIKDTGTKVTSIKVIDDKEKEISKSISIEKNKKVSVKVLDQVGNNVSNGCDVSDGSKYTATFVTDHYEISGNTTGTEDITFTYKDNPSITKTLSVSIEAKTIKVQYDEDSIKSMGLELYNSYGKELKDGGSVSFQLANGSSSSITFNLVAKVNGNKVYSKEETIRQKDSCLYTIFSSEIKDFSELTQDDTIVISVEKPEAKTIKVAYDETSAKSLNLTFNKYDTSIAENTPLNFEIYNGAKSTVSFDIVAKVNDNTVFKRPAQNVEASKTKNFSIESSEISGFKSLTTEDTITISLTTPSGEKTIEIKYECELKDFSIDGATSLTQGSNLNLTVTYSGGKSGDATIQFKNQSSEIIYEEKGTFESGGTPVIIESSKIDWSKVSTGDKCTIYLNDGK